MIVTGSSPVSAILPANTDTILSTPDFNAPTTSFTWSIVNIAVTLR